LPSLKRGGLSLFEWISGFSLARRALTFTASWPPINPHDALTLNGAGNVKDARIEEHYTCGCCCGIFARILIGPPARQIWMLLNEGQH
jgi:hypothetical protein